MVIWGSQDLAAISLWPADRLAGLAHPLGEGNNHPAAAALREVRRRTKPDQPILVFSMDSQHYALVQRRLSGLLYAYWPGVFGGALWGDRNLEALRRDPPALVVVRDDFFAAPPAQPDLAWQGRASHPAVERFVRERYQRVAYRGGGLILLETGP
jgi:hypothetical protein